MGSHITARAFVAASLTMIGLVAFPVRCSRITAQGLPMIRRRRSRSKARSRNSPWKNPHSALFMNVTDGPFKGKNYAAEKLIQPGRL